MLAVVVPLCWGTVCRASQRWNYSYLERRCKRVLTCVPQNKGGYNIQYKCKEADRRNYT